MSCEHERHLCERMSGSSPLSSIFLELVSAGEFCELECVCGKRALALRKFFQHPIENAF